MFPDKRNRRLRKNQSIRDMVQENRLHPSDFIVPLFFMEGQNTKEEIASMPGYYRYTLDLLVDEVKSCYDLGIRSALLFAKVEDSLKDNEGKEAINPKGLMQRAIRLLKKEIPEMYLMSDVALDPYSIHGHDGIVDGEEILNDETLDVLAEMAVSHAEAGVDMVAPSDMMDGRIGIIRESLENEGFPNVGIMSYSVKYASNYYGPFRDALESTPGFGDKKTYQMNPANALEGLSEVERDIEEGADIIMIKPAMMYLDIIRQAADQFTHPICAYQVSGEYAMINYIAQESPEHAKNIIIESLVSIKRAGSDMVISYFSEFILKNILT